MSHWRRLSRKHRALYLSIAVLALAATALASGRLPFGSGEGPSLPDATMPTPADIFVQKTEAFPELGNVLVTVQLTPDQMKVKKAQGTASYMTLGAFGSQVLFRDDGQQGDGKAGDGLFTAVVNASEEDLAERAADDLEALEGGALLAPVFVGRTLVGSREQEAFDIGGFRAGRAVRLNTGTGPVTGGPFEPGEPLEPADPPTEFQEKVLMIRQTSVVEDPDRTINPCDLSGTAGGVWTFEHLMTEMAYQSASGINPSTFTKNWMLKWANDQSINSFTVPKRQPGIMAILSSWDLASGGTGTLDLSQAPFRLLAIVPRFDLREARTAGSSGSGAYANGGELRFVFGMVLPSGWTRPPKLPRGYGAREHRLDDRGCIALPFTVIFEYKVPKNECRSLQQWARKWVNLGGLDLGSPTYNSRLEALTEEVVKAGTAPSRPNQNAIGQIRTNEETLDSPWQLREFRLTSTPWSQIQETETVDTPDDSFNDAPLFGDWVLNDVVPAIGAPTWDQAIPTVPGTYGSGSTPFLGAHPEAPTNGFHWSRTGLNLIGDLSQNWGRHRASLASCNGCHAGETRTNFVHIDPLTRPAALSRFLTGINVGDPANAGSPVRTFDDLVRREADLRQFARALCWDVATVSHERLLEGLQLNRLPLVTGEDGTLTVSVDAQRIPVVREVH